MSVNVIFQEYIPISGGFEVSFTKFSKTTGTGTIECKKLRRATGAVVPSVRALAVRDDQTVGITGVVLSTTTKESIVLNTLEFTNYHLAGLHYGGGNLGE